MRSDACSLRLSVEPRSSFSELTGRLLRSHADFPADRARTARIVKALRAGAEPWPIFVDEEEGFVMEGRHRVVAFHRLGLAEIPMVRVSRAEPSPVPGP